MRCFLLCSADSVLTGAMERAYCRRRRAVHGHYLFVFIDEMVVEAGNCLFLLFAARGLGRME
jgi:hypothetical protein